MLPLPHGRPRPPAPRRLLQQRHPPLRRRRLRQPDKSPPTCSQRQQAAASASTPDQAGAEPAAGGRKLRRSAQNDCRDFRPFRCAGTQCPGWPVCCGLNHARRKPVGMTARSLRWHLPPLAPQICAISGRLQPAPAAIAVPGSLQRQVIEATGIMRCDLRRDRCGIVRGGAWSDMFDRKRPLLRQGVDPCAAMYWVGFRVAESAA